MFDLDRVTIDPASGRPVAPVAWRLTPFWVGLAFGTAALLLTASALAAQDGELLWAAASGITAVFVLGFTEWRRRQIKRRELAFRQKLEDYERGIRKPLDF